jgi:hypothetical protein
MPFYRRADHQRVEFLDYARVQKRFEDALHNGAGVEQIVNNNFLKVRLPDDDARRELAEAILAEMGYERRKVERRR